MGGEYELRVRELPFQKSTNLPAVSCIDRHEHVVEDREREYSGLFSYRFSNYRIICRIRQKKLYIVVLRVRRRKKVYDGLQSLFRKGTPALYHIADLILAQHVVNHGVQRRKQRIPKKRPYLY
jgi:mRNA-degrading endonuclease RelE of RelBE toxin-antitoxin system